MRISRKTVVCLIVSTLALLTPTPGFAATSPTPVEVAPLRLVAEAVGAQVEWDGTTRTVTVRYDDTTLALKIGSETMQVGSRSVSLGQPAVIENDRMVVPLAPIKEALGIQVSWDTSSRHVTVDEPATTALSFFRALTRGKVDRFQPQMSAGFQTALQPALVPTVAAAIQQGFGSLNGCKVVGQPRNQVHQNVELSCAFEHMPLKVLVRYDNKGKLDDYAVLTVNPVQAPGSPTYANSQVFTNREVVVGEGTPWALPGTLSMPLGKAIFPAVVLVHGSGPNDRDETAGAIKPFRDLAEGLASQGIAVLRYEKRVLEHAVKSTFAPTFTVMDETISDAVAAVQLLQTTEGIDPKRIFVLGHSLSGHFLPTILAQAGARDVAGGIGLAAPNGLLDILVKQNQLMYANEDAPAAQVAFVEQQVALLKDPSWDPKSPPQGFLLGSPFYWDDYRGRAATVAKGQKTPLLLLQGSRDFQVPGDELQTWKEELKARTDVTFKLYPKLNHFFTEGEGQISKMAEYLAPANLPSYVIDDIANWIKLNK